MTATPTALVDAQYVSASGATVYTATKTTLITAVSVNNGTSSSANVTIHLVPTSGTAGAANKVVSDRTIGPDRSYQCPEVQGHVLEVGDMIYAAASTASALVLHVSGLAFDPV